MPIKTLVVDDAVTYRKIVSDILKSIPDIELTGTAPSGSIALKKLTHSQIDLVLLDTDMPDMNGLETLKRIRSDFPSVAVVMMTGKSSRNKKDTIDALECGAIDFISKEENDDYHINFNILKCSINSVIQLIELKKNKLRSRSKIIKGMNNTISNQQLPAEKTKNRIDSFSICVIGVSTGGPEALNILIPQIPANFPIPILIVQHMPVNFTKSLAESLNKKSSLRVIEAPDNCEILPGTVYIAPGGKHMTVCNIEGKMLICHSDAPPVNSCRPSADVLFRSVASNYLESGILAIILTGMGNDGCCGIEMMKRQKCFCITQTEFSCVVYGMPRAVEEAGLSDLSLPVENIASEMVNLTIHSFSASNTHDQSYNLKNCI